MDINIHRCQIYWTDRMKQFVWNCYSFNEQTVTITTRSLHFIEQYRNVNSINIGAKTVHFCYTVNLGPMRLDLSLRF